MVRSRQSRIKNYFAENRLFTIRSIVAGVIAAVLLLAVAGRLFYLQVHKGRLLLQSVAGQQHPHRADTAQPRV